MVFWQPSAAFQDVAPLASLSETVMFQSFVNYISNLPTKEVFKHLLCDDTTTSTSVVTATIKVRPSFHKSGNC